MTQYEKQAQEFADYMFKKVVDTAVEKGAETKTYCLPVVRFTDCRTREQETRMRELDQVYAIVTDGIPDEQRLQAAAAKMGNDLQELIRYAEMLPPNVDAKFERQRNVIVLDNEVEKEGRTYSAVTRNVLRSARMQMVDEYNIGNTARERTRTSILYQRGQLPPGTYIMPEVKEFFPSLTDILLGENNGMTMEQLRDDAAFFRGNIMGKLDEMLDAYAKGQKELAESIRDRIFKSKTYASLVAGMPEVSVNQMMMGLAAITIIPQENLEATKKMLGFAVQLKDKYGFEGGNDPRGLAELAVDNSKEQLADDWAKTIFASGPDIDDTYIQPVRDKIEEMTKRIEIDQEEIDDVEKKLVALAESP